MRINLCSEAAAGDGPEIEIHEFFAEHDRVSWDERSPFKTNLATIAKDAVKEAKKRTGAPMVLDQLSLDRIGPINGVRYYFFSAHVQHEDGEGDPVMLVMDLQGKLVESETIKFKDEKAYEKYLKKKHPP